MLNTNTMEVDSEIDSEVNSEVDFNSLEIDKLAIKVKSSPKNYKKQEFVLDLYNMKVVETGARRLFFIRGILVINRTPIPIVCLVDNGAAASAMTLKLASEISINLNKSNCTYRSVCGTVKPVEGKTDPVRLDVGKLPFMLELIVIPSQQNWDILLGLDFLEDTETSIIHSRAGNNLMMWNGSVVKAISDEDKENVKEDTLVEVHQ